MQPLPYPTAPTLAGVTFRHAVMPDDLPAMNALAIQALRERGMTEGALGVDTENASGALRLYESCGFVRVSSDTTYQKPLD